LFVAGVSFEKSAFKVSDFPYKVVAAMLIVTFWRETQNFQKAISCHVFDRILKVRPFLNPENFKFKEYFKIL
jgi:hypothetical protein